MSRYNKIMSTMIIILILTQQSILSLMPQSQVPLIVDEVNKKVSILSAFKENLKRAADLINLNPLLKNKLTQPVKITEVEWNVQMDDASLESFHGFRCWHNDARGAGKGGFRFIIKKESTDIEPFLKECKNTAIGLASLMSIKNAISGIPFGGGKGDVILNKPKNEYSERELALIVRGFVKGLIDQDALGALRDIPAPDVLTGDQEMQWFLEEYLKCCIEKNTMQDKELQKILKQKQESKQFISEANKTPYLDHLFEILENDHEGYHNVPELGVVTGKKVGKGGSKGRTEATGYGGFLALKAVIKNYKEYFDLSKKTIELQKILLRDNLKNVSISVQGTGNVAEFFMKSAFDDGALIQDIQDHTGMLTLNEKERKNSSIKIKLLYRILKRYSDGRVETLKNAYQTNERFQQFLNKFNIEFIEDDPDKIWETDTEIKVAAAIENVITEDNVEKFKGQILLELANNPTTPRANDALLESNVLIIPDVYANIGGVTVSYFEWIQNLLNRYWPIHKVNKLLEDRMTKSFLNLAQVASRFDVDLRQAAFIFGITSISNAEIARLEEKSSNEIGEYYYDFHGELGQVPETNEALKETIENKQELKKMIEIEEDKHEKTLQKICNDMLDSIDFKNEKSCVLLSGPPSSGKFQTVERLMNLLNDSGAIGDKISVHVDIDYMCKPTSKEDINEWFKTLNVDEGFKVQTIAGGEEKISFKTHIPIMTGKFPLDDDIINEKSISRFRIAVNPAPCFKLDNNKPLTSQVYRLMCDILTKYKYHNQPPDETINDIINFRYLDFSRDYANLGEADAYFNPYLTYCLPAIKPMIKPFLDDAHDSALRDKRVIEIQLNSAIQMLSKVEKKMIRTTWIKWGKMIVSLNWNQLKEMWVLFRKKLHYDSSIEISHEALKKAKQNLKRIEEMKQVIDEIPEMSRDDFKLLPQNSIIRQFMVNGYENLMLEKEQKEFSHSC